MNERKRGIVKKRNRVVKKKRSRIKYRNIVILLALIAFLSFGIFLVFKLPINNIIVIGNEFLSDQEIIDAAGLRNYPSTLNNSKGSIKRRLERETYIKSVKVTKKHFLTKTVIEVEENKPLFFYMPENKTVLEDGIMVEDKFNVPTVVNKIPDSVYDRLLPKMANVPNEVLIRISEIRYTPNDVDQELFFMTMSDGNYVYLNIFRFGTIHNYVEYVEEFNNRKGILRLDSGNYLYEPEGN